VVGDRVVDRGRDVPLAEEAVGFVGFVVPVVASEWRVVRVEGWGFEAGFGCGFVLGLDMVGAALDEGVLGLPCGFCLVCDRCFGL